MLWSTSPYIPWKIINGLLTKISDYLRDIRQLSVCSSIGNLSEASKKSIQEDVEWRLIIIKKSLAKISTICNGSKSLRDWWTGGAGSKGVDLGNLGLETLNFLDPQRVKPIYPHKLGKELNSVKYFKVNEREIKELGIQFPFHWKSKIKAVLDNNDRFYLRADPNETFFKN